MIRGTSSFHEPLHAPGPNWCAASRPTNKNPLKRWSACCTSSPAGTEPQLFEAGTPAHPGRCSRCTLGRCGGAPASACHCTYTLSGHEQLPKRLYRNRWCRRSTRHPMIACRDPASRARVWAGHAVAHPRQASRHWLAVKQVISPSMPALWTPIPSCPAILLPPADAVERGHKAHRRAA